MKRIIYLFLAGLYLGAILANAMLTRVENTQAVNRAALKGMW